MHKCIEGSKSPGLSGSLGVYKNMKLGSTWDFLFMEFSPLFTLSFLRKEWDYLELKITHKSSWRKESVETYIRILQCNPMA